MDRRGRWCPRVRLHAGSKIDDVGAYPAAGGCDPGAAVVAFDTRNAAGQRMLDGTMLNAVLLLMLATSILGPVLTERFAPRMLEGALRDNRQTSA
jgi:hypothetical protein